MIALGYDLGLGWTLLRSEPGPRALASTEKARALLTYILRRLGAGLLLLAVVTMVTFAIFYVVPRWAGRTTEQLATMYVGRAPTPEAIQATIERLGLDQPIAVQFWEFVRGIFFGAQYQFGRDTIECAAPCFGYSFQTYQEVFPEIIARLPVTASSRSARA